MKIFRAMLSKSLEWTGVVGTELAIDSSSGESAVFEMEMSIPVAGYGR